MRRLSGFLAAAASVLFILCALLTAVDLCCFDLDFYDSEYRKLDTARTIGIGHTSLMTVTEALLDYTRGGAEELDVQAEINGHNVAVYNEREVAHMADVRSLYTAAMTVRNLGLALCVLLFAVSLFIFKKERLRRISKCYFVGAVVCLVLFGAAVLWAGIDFNSFWTAFHQLFFTNDLWQLDSSSSVLINMVPAQFFYDLVMRIVRMFAVFVGVPLLLARGYLVYHRIRRRSLLAFREKGESDAK